MSRERLIVERKHDPDGIAHNVVKIIRAIRDAHHEIQGNRRVRDKATGELVRVPTQVQATDLMILHQLLYHELGLYEEAVCD